MDRRSFLKGLFATVAVAKTPLKLLAPKAPSFPVEYLARTELWNKQVKELLWDDLSSMKFTKIFEK